MDTHATHQERYRPHSVRLRETRRAQGVVRAQGRQKPGEDRKLLPPNWGLSFFSHLGAKAPSLRASGNRGSGLLCFPGVESGSVSGFIVFPVLLSLGLCCLVLIAMQWV